MTCPEEPLPLARCAPGVFRDRGLSWPFLGSNVMRSIHGVGELMTQVVLRGGGFLPMTPTATAPEGNVKQAEPEKEDIMVMDTKLKIIEILQVTMGLKWGQECASQGSICVQWPCFDGAPGFREESGGRFLALSAISEPALLLLLLPSPVCPQHALSCQPRQTFSSSPRFPSALVSVVSHTFHLLRIHSHSVHS